MGSKQSLVLETKGLHFFSEPTTDSGVCQLFYFGKWTEPYLWEKGVKAFY